MTTSPRWGWLAALAALAVLVLATAAFADPKFPALTGRVVDDAQILSPATEQRLTGELAALETQTGHQVVVATLPNLQGYEIEDFGYQLGRAWALGRKGEDDGAILLVAPAERKVRIEVGYGLEPVLTDALSSVILQTKLLPQFREGRMEQGVIDGTEALVQHLALPEDQAKARVAQAAQAQKARGDGGFAPPLIFVIFIVFWLLSGLFRGRGRSGAWWLLPLLLSGSGRRDGWGGGGGWRGGGGGGGFSGGGGSFGGGGSSGSW